MAVNDAYAEDLPYWKTSQSAPDKWLERIGDMIRKSGGEVLQQGFLQSNGRAAYMLMFSLGENRFKITWPVMQSKDQKSDYAAKVQAVTMMYHDVKNRLVTAMVHGFRAAFLEYFLLPDGRTLGIIAEPELLSSVPKLLGG